MSFVEHLKAPQKPTDTQQFLARAVAPGNYLAVAHNKGPGTPINQFRFFCYGDFAQVASFVAWAVSKGWDTYHAQAAFTAAVPDGLDKRGNTKFKGERKGPNVQRLRSFWIDLDVKRDGDKKDPATCYGSIGEALAWLDKFRSAMNLPPTSMGVCSGYGLHAYWVIEDVITAADWQPYANALKAALMTRGFRGDAGISADSVRLLRPPGTVNMKSGKPVPVAAIDDLTGPDVPNATMFTALQPYVPAGPATSAAGILSPAQALSGGGGATVLAFAAAGVPKADMNAAATANLFVPE